MMLFCIFLVLLGETCQGQPNATRTLGIVQDTGIIRAEIGKNVTLHCFCQNDVTHISWYQQSLGGELCLISTRMKQITVAEMSPAFQKRFHVLAHARECSNHLTITDLQASDSATYFCAVLEFNGIEFGPGAFLHVRASLSNTQPVVHQPVVEELRPGDSLNLSCTVYAESQCASEQSLYWIKHGAAGAAVLTFPSAGQCTTEKSHKRNCTFNLEIHSASASDAGMYYCALASCGEIVFGDGTRVEIIVLAFPVLLCCLSVAFVLSMNVLLIMAVKTYKLQKKLCSVCKGAVSHPTCSAAISQDGHALYYLPLSVKRNNNLHRQGNNMETACVYSRVKSGRK
ncbi:uncharacterized protein LOC131456984 [Solea solea]|uniref:uncharacterized protein LOC131456984 n=1 Tax=Solea solea TaxID=90069 RepID=UPI00272C81BF|nr:uncharacterized protein LOC131456984 [Solea solea]